VAATLLIDGEEFWAALEEDIAQARDRIYVQTLSFEGDSVGKKLAAAMLASSARDRRIIVDSFTKWIQNDRFLYAPRNLLDAELQAEARATRRMIRELREGGVEVQFVNPTGLLLRRLAARNHKKIVVVDDRAAYLGGNNFSEHNFSWHDLMVRVESRAVIDYLSSDFEATWGGSNRCGVTRVGDYEFLSLDGRDNPRVFERLRDLIGAARETIFVESPYLTLPFASWLREASQRGVSVTVVAPELNNWRLMRGYMAAAVGRDDIELRLLQGRFTHLKALLVDGERLVLGSSNFDRFSYRLHQELLVIVADSMLIDEFRARVVAPDLAGSRPHSGKIGKIEGSLHILGLRMVFRLIELLNCRL